MTLVDLKLVHREVENQLELVFAHLCPGATALSIPSEIIVAVSIALPCSATLDVKTYGCIYTSERVIPGANLKT